MSVHVIGVVDRFLAAGVSPEARRSWLNTARPELDGRSPIEALALFRGERVIQLLEQDLAATAAYATSAGEGDVRSGPAASDTTATGTS